MSATIPQEVTDWIEARKGFRTPVHSPGDYQQFADSKAAACWGSHGGTDTGTGYRVAVCQPSPQSKGDKAFLYFDYIKQPN